MPNGLVTLSEAKDPCIFLPRADSIDPSFRSG